MSIPSKAFNTHRGDVAAEAAKTLEQGDADTGSCGRNGSGQPRRSATDNQDIGGVNDIQLSGRFDYFHCDSEHSYRELLIFNRFLFDVRLNCRYTTGSALSNAAKFLRNKLG